MNIEQRFAGKYKITSNGCWQWLRNINNYGYGRITINNKNLYAHRVSYEYYYGKSLSGLEIDHLCNNPACVNPKHLEAVSHKENSLRSNNIGGVNARKTHCPYGHKFTEQNMYSYTNKQRTCKTCIQQRSREYKRKKRLLKEVS